MELCQSRSLSGYLKTRAPLQNALYEAPSNVDDCLIITSAAHTDEGSKRRCARKTIWQVHPLDHPRNGASRFAFHHPSWHYSQKRSSRGAWSGENFRLWLNRTGRIGVLGTLFSGAQTYTTLFFRGIYQLNMRNLCSFADHAVAYLMYATGNHTDWCLLPGVWSIVDWSAVVGDVQLGKDVVRFSRNKAENHSPIRMLVDKGVWDVLVVPHFALSWV